MRCPADRPCALLARGTRPGAACRRTESPPAPHQFLWEVSSLTNRVYLYGTVHAGKASFFPLAAPVQKAFAESKVLAVEADITDAAAMEKSASAMRLTPPDTLSKHVPAPVYERFRKQLARFGVPEPQVAQLKPFIAASLLAFAEWGRQGYMPQYGVDLYLITRAREAKKRSSSSRARRRRRRSWTRSPKRRACRPSRAPSPGWKAASRATRSPAW